MKNMLTRAVTSLTAIALLAGCSGTSGTSGTTTTAAAETVTESETLLETIQARGTIIVAMEGTWAPWTYHDEDDALVGYDVEVATEIAHKLGVEPEFVEGEWDGLLAGLSAGRYDIMVNGVTISDERKETYNFSQPYGYNRTAVITRADDDSISTIEDLDGKTTANTISSTYAEIAEGYGATVIGVDDFNQTIELLMRGDIDATLNDEVVFMDYLRAQPDAQVKISCYDSESTTVGIPVRKDASTDSLLEAINKALDELRADGTLTELSMKYFGVDISEE